MIFLHILWILAILVFGVWLGAYTEDEKLKKEHAALVKELKADIVELRKWKADHIGERDA